MVKSTKRDFKINAFLPFLTKIGTVLKARIPKDTIYFFSAQMLHFRPEFRYSAEIWTFD